MIDPTRAEIGARQSVPSFAHVALDASAQAPPLIALAYADLAVERGHRLPSDHPHWRSDHISLGSRARAFFHQLRPIAIRALGFWDHRIRSVTCAMGSLSVDESGCYRLD